MLKHLTNAVCFAIAASVSIPSCFPQAVGNSRLFWLNQAVTTSDELLKEAVPLTSPQRTLLFGHLAKIWHKRDKVKARRYMQKAVDEVGQVPNRETVTEKNQRLSSARTLLALAVNFDSDLTQEISSILNTDVGQDSGEQRNANATALVRAALAVVESDPGKALSLGLMSVKVGRTLDIIHLLSKLSMRDRKAGDRLFLEVLSVAGRTRDVIMFGALARLAFVGRAPSEPIRERTLSVLADLLLRAAQTDVLCDFASIAASLIPQFRGLLPNRAQTVEAAIARCGNSSSGLVETSTGRTSDPQLKSVDDFLRAADETNNRDRRLFLRSRAAYLASQNKEYDRAISILDALDEEEQAQLGDTWDNWRWDFAAAAALQRLEHDDLPGLDRVVYATPVRLRAFVEIAVAGEMDKRHQDKAVELLQDARRNLAKATSVSLDWYLSLVRPYVKFLPQDGTNVLEDFVKSINRTKENVDDASTQNSSFDLTPVELPTVLLENDLARVRSIIADINAKAMRLRLTLSILECQLRLAEQQPSTSEISGQ